MSTATFKVTPNSQPATTIPAASRRPTGTEVRDRLLSYLIPYRFTLFVGLLCGTLIGVVKAGIADRLETFTKGLKTSTAHSEILTVCLGVVVLYIIMGGLKYGQSVLLSTVAQRVGLGLRRDVYSRLQQFSLSYFHQRRTGAILSTLQSDVPKMQNAAMILKDVVATPIQALVYLFVLFKISWQLTAFVLLAVPVMAFAIQKLTRRLRAISEETQERLADVSAIMEETISAPRIVRAFTAEKREIVRFEKASERAISSQLRAIRRSSQLSPVVDVIGAIGVAGALYLGGTLVTAGQMDAGKLFKFLYLVAELATCVNAMGGLKSGWEDMMGAADRIFAGVLDVEPTINDSPDAISLPAIEGKVVFDHVSFAYLADSPVLTDINLTIEAGQVVAFVGETGAGKSTLADLVPRFYDPTAGRITVDGFDIRNVTMASLRKQIGIVPQESVLFSGTLRDNLTYGKPDATDAEVQAAARVTNIAEFIESLPDGYETRVGERGSTLSGGQRQRVAIARALLADPRILILDEATSALDAKTESLVQEALDTLLKGRTTLIIAHRLSTIRNADKIVVLSQGKIVEIGTHTSLLAQDGIYARLYATQAKQKEQG